MKLLFQPMLLIGMQRGEAHDGIGRRRGLAERPAAEDQTCQGRSAQAGNGSSAHGDQGAGESFSSRLRVSRTRANGCGRERCTSAAENST